MNGLLERQLRHNKIILRDLQENVRNLMYDISKSYDQLETDSPEIGEKNNTEIQLLDLTAIIKELLQNISSGILVEDEQKKIILVNVEYCNMFNIKERSIDFIGADFSKYTELSKSMFADPINFEKRISEILTSNIAVKGEELHLLDGRILERDFIPVFIKEEYHGSFWKYSDITERKRIEEELKEFKAFYEQTMHELSGQIVVFDSDFRYLYVNPATVADPEIRQWMIGKDDYEYCESGGIDKSVADLRRRWLNVAKNEKRQVHFEEELKNINGTTRFLERKISPIISPDNEVIRLIIYDTDITEIKMLVRNLEYSNKALTDLAYIASHDLREPLRKISAFGSLLQKTLTSKLDEDERENLNFIIEGANRMQMMITDLLYYSRITTKAKAYSLINIDELLDEIIHFELSQIIEDNHASVIVENKLGAIKGESTQIKQLFQNLIANGIKYKKKTTDPVIKIGSQKYAYGIEVRVEDNGIGIDNKYKEQIFEMFKRLHSKEEYDGSGIGLAVCKKIIELYNGEIEVKSEPGIGSAFIFRLPYVE